MNLRDVMGCHNLVRSVFILYQQIVVIEETIIFCIEKSENSLPRKLRCKLLYYFVSGAEKNSGSMVFVTFQTLLGLEA